MRREFNLLWTATGLSNLGDGVRAVVMPLLAASLTSNPLLIAMVAVVERVAWLAAALPGGDLADRVDRRTVRVVLDVVRGVVVAVLVLLLAIDQLSLALLVAIAAILAAAESVVDSSSMAIIPATVDQSDLERAGSRLMGTELVVGSMLGPALGGLLFGVAVTAAFGINAVTFLAAALVMALNPGASNRPVRDPGSPGMPQRVREGMAWLLRTGELRALALMSTALGAASMVWTAVFVLYATDTLGLSALGFSVLAIVASLGGVAGSLVAPALAKLPLRWTLFAAVMISAAALGGLAVTRSPWVAAVLVAVSNGGVLVWNVLTVAKRQRLVPDAVLGRVSAGYRFLVQLGMPLGALAGGGVAKAYGLPAAFVVAGVMTAVAGAAVPFVLRNGAEVASEAPQ
ncbi:MFS transporter [Nocardioides zeae]|uniref:MFS family permease n=1 Tax=Nocardioides zeae TaxID=1457234 RepID=A0AAJ1U486_9ACTN|nr:MFS transporter [Nocardioides zeae]MDQ1104803.1 MFS family permease [Nocardioides zeae]